MPPAVHDGFEIRRERSSVSEFGFGTARVGLALQKNRSGRRTRGIGRTVSRENKNTAYRLERSGAPSTSRARESRAGHPRCGCF